MKERCRGRKKTERGRVRERATERERVRDGEVDREVD